MGLFVIATDTPEFISPSTAMIIQGRIQKGGTLFTDGAGAWLIGPDDENSYLTATQMYTDGTQWDYVGVYSGGTRNPVTVERINAGEYGLQRLPGNRNVELWPMVMESLITKARKKQNEADHYLFTQINREVIVKVMEIIDQPMEKTTCIMDRYGYTGSACIPMAFHEAVKKRRINRGDEVLIMAFGAGLAVSSALFIY